MTRRTFVSSVFILLGGCAAPALLPLPADHPASPLAAEPRATLHLRALDDRRTEPAAGTASAPATSSGHAMSAPPSAAAGKLFTCTMHPEVRSKQPGRCPKCGMTLVPVAAASEHDHAQ